MGSYVPNTYRKGLLPLIILLLLKKEDMYGYQLVKEIEARTTGIIKTQEGSLYPVLFALSDAGYISEHKVVVSGRRFRLFYPLEPAGEQYLKEQVTDYQQVADSMRQLITNCMED